MSIRVWYFTMTAAQAVRHFGRHVGSGYVAISAPSADAAREKMFAVYDDGWSMQYDSLEQLHPLDDTCLAHCEVEE